MTARVIEALCGFAPRGACTDGERRAAAWLHDDLRERGHEAWVETHWVRPAWAVPVALAALLGAAGSMLSVTVPAAGIAAGAAGALALALEAAGRVSPLRMLGARRATQHVLAGSPPLNDPFGHTRHTPRADATAAPVAMIVAAGYDAPRGGLLLGERGRRIGARLRNVRAWLALCCAIVAGCAAARAGGVDATWLGAVQLVPTIVLLAATAGALDVATSGFAPGANDNAPAAAVALALHEELSREPPTALSPSLLLVGAASSGPESLRAHVRREAIDPAQAVLLVLGPCAGGAPAWSTRHPQLRGAAERAADALGAEPRSRGPQPPRVRRIPAIRVGCDAAATDAALDLALGVVDALDAELAAAGASRPAAVR